jgi:hypothetical protein
MHRLLWKEGTASLPLISVLPVEPDQASVSDVKL